MPPWLVQILIQYPIVVVIGYVAWYSYTELKATTAEHRNRERELHSDALARLTAAHSQLVAAKDADIARLGKELKDDVKGLAKKVDELKKRLDP